MISEGKGVRSNFLTLVAQLIISFILSQLHKLLQRGLALIPLGVWVTANKGDTYGAVNL